MSDPTAPPRPTPKPFDEFLAEFRRGQLRDELSRALHDVLAEVISTEKAGSVTLTLKVVSVGDLQVAITGDVTQKLPRPPAPASHFYVDHDGNPSRHDPYQQRMNVDPQPALTDTTEEN